ncbi:MAG: hypothetical protein JWM88_88 [Verrucomicrobia bacterium]|nr:hypothetical protein [Verrucomicrobiota bacterium]
MNTLLRRLLLFSAVISATAAEAPRAGESFIFEQAGRRVTVRYFQPPGAAADAPVVFVMHGVQRNGEEYFGDWVPLAARRHFLLVVPEFSRSEFPGDEGYNFGNIATAAGAPVPREEWSFNMIEPIFDAVRARAGNRSGHYLLYGHSAGAQFVQRFPFFVPGARVSRAVAANAGWYMLPDRAVAFPYGLRDAPVSDADVRAALARPLVVLLGTADIDPKHKALRHTPEAEAQGPHRFARGRYFFEHARDAAAALHAPFGWSLATAPGIAHSDRGMSPFAVDCLLPETPSAKKPNEP